MNKKVTICTLSNSHDLARKISIELNAEYRQMPIYKFASCEICPYLEDGIENEMICFIHSILPSDNSFLEILLAIDATKKSKAKNIILVIPYLSYARQDNNKDNKPNSIAVILKILASLDINTILICDIHNQNSILQIREHCIKNNPITNIINLKIEELICQDILQITKAEIIVSPDQGSKKRINNIYKKVLPMEDPVESDIIEKLQHINLEKTRNSKNEVSYNSLEPDESFTNKSILIIDDIIDTGSTILEAIKTLKTTI